MDTEALVASIIEEIARLEEVKQVLTGGIPERRGAKRGPKPGWKSKAAKRTMSAEGRARIAAAQRAKAKKG